MKFIKIDGSTAPQKRQALVDRFQLESDIQVAVLSIRAAGVGLTLTVMRYAICPPPSSKP